MVYELILIGGGIIFSLIGFFIGILLIRRAYKQSPSILHYKNIIDILTLRKLHNKLYGADYVKKLKTGQDHIEHYENIRDKLTVRKKKEIEVTNEGSGSIIGGGMLGNLIGGFIVIFIGISLIPVIMQQVGIAKNSTNQNNVTTPSTQLSDTMLNMIPLFFGLAMVGVAIAIIAGALRSSGVV
jgi:hypothetical protein